MPTKHIKLKIISWQDTMNHCGIYKITNKINNHSYIGQSVNIKARWAAHKSYYKTTAKSRDDKYFNCLLYTAMRKYGIENFDFSIIEECPTEKLDEKEKYWIKYYDTYNKGYNMTKGGDGSPHETNGRAILTLEDVIKIRTMYDNKTPFREAYETYKDIISKRGFQKVWQGETWADVMPEVYNEENKKFHKTKAKSLPAHNRKLTVEEVIKARQAKQNGEKVHDYWEKHIKGKMSLSGFEKVWNGQYYNDASVSCND